MFCFLMHRDSYQVHVLTGTFTKQTGALRKNTFRDLDTQKTPLYCLRVYRKLVFLRVVPFV